MRVEQRGFTLLELLLAVLVFGLIAAGSYGVLNSITRASAVQEQAGERLRVVQLGMLRLERELRQMIAVEANGTSLAGNRQDLHFSTLVPVPSGSMSEIRQVSYRYSGNSLYRIAGPAAVETGSPGNAHLLIPGLRSFTINYLDEGGNWRETWTAHVSGELPRAISVQLGINELGPVERIVELPGDRR